VALRHIHALFWSGAFFTLCALVRRLLGPNPSSRFLIYGDGILSCLEVCSSGFGLLSP